MNITLYAICKNEQQNVEKFIKNSKKFFHTVVVDTGSTDNTVQLLRNAGIQVYEHPQTREEFDFSLARNQALSYVKTDWAFSLDFNEDIEDFNVGGLSVISDEATSFRHLRYNQNKNELGQSNEVYVRFHRTKNYKWANAVHEIPVFIFTEEFSEEKIISTSIKITKNIHKSLDKELFYLSICEREYEKNTQEWFYLWFIFNHYFEVNNLGKALDYGQEFLNITKPYFNSFRVECFIKCSQILLQKNETQKGFNYAFHALSEAMNIGSEYMGMAFTYLLQIGIGARNPDLVVFASGFSEKTKYLKDRIDAIHYLFVTSREEDPYNQRSSVIEGENL